MKKLFWYGFFVTLIAVLFLLSACVILKDDDDDDDDGDDEEDIVLVEEILVEEIILFDRTITEGQEINIGFDVQPFHAANKTLTWSSSDPTTVQVLNPSQPRVRALKSGAATITAAAIDESNVKSTCVITVVPPENPSTEIKEYRGVIAVRSGTGNFVSWRLYLNDPDGIGFYVLRNGTRVSSLLGPNRTNFQDAGAPVGATYQIEMVIANAPSILVKSETTVALSTDYIRINIVKPTGNYLSDGTPYLGEYSAGDGTVADLDGDGVNEIIFFWQPANLQDNSLNGLTGNVYIDAYKLDGTRMWPNPIDLGPNIRAGAHYQTFVVYDFDGSGKAKIAVKTADGTKDAHGTVIGQAGVYHVNTPPYQGNNREGFILRGPEYLSVFCGETGSVLDTVDYIPARGAVNSWGNNEGYGNRVDRMHSCAAYLGGPGTSMVFQRGYYGRTVLAAWDLVNNKLVHRWTFDSNNYSNAGGQGNHSLSVADVDGSGKDSIILGSLAIKWDGTLLWNSRQGHGDAMHVGKFDPSRSGLQVMSAHEESPFGISMKDAASGVVIWRQNGTADTGRGMVADICPVTPGSESWGTSQVPGIFSAAGVRLNATIPANVFANMAIFWYGDTSRQLFDGGFNYGGANDNPRISMVTRSGSGVYSAIIIKDFGAEVSTWGDTKRNPMLVADILGDWREEIILRAKDNSHIRIYTTTMSTIHTDAGKVPDYGIPTLMDNHQYRMAIAWQHTGYNQPPHTSWQIGHNMPEIRAPNVPADGISLNKNSTTLVETYTELLTATVSPANATIKYVEWTSNNTAVATVADGLVTAVSPGTAVITARSMDGNYFDHCLVTVSPFLAVTIFNWDAATDPAFAAIPANGSRTINGKIAYNFFRDSNNAQSPNSVPIAVVQAGDKLKGAQGSDVEWTIQRAGYLLVENTSPCLQIGSSATTRTTTSTIPNTNGQFDLRKPVRITVTYTGISAGSNDSGIMIGLLNNTGAVATSPLGALSSQDINLVIDGNVKTYERIFNPVALGFNSSQMTMLSTGFITVRCTRAAGWVVVHSIKIEQLP